MQVFFFLKKKQSLFIKAGFIKSDALFFRNALISFTPGSFPVQQQSDLFDTEQLLWSSRAQLHLTGGNL